MEVFYNSLPACGSCRIPFPQVPICRLSSPSVVHSFRESLRGGTLGEWNGMEVFYNLNQSDYLLPGGERVLDGKVVLYILLLRRSPGL